MAVGPGMVWGRGLYTSRRGFRVFPADYTDWRAELMDHVMGEGIRGLRDYRVVLAWELLGELEKQETDADQLEFKRPE